MFNKIAFLCSTLSKQFNLLFSSKKSRRKRWPPVKKLSRIHIQNCRLFEDRVRLLDEIPPNGVVAEIGIWKCGFSKQIIEKVRPVTFHLVDIDPRSIQIANELFEREIDGGSVNVHLKDSSSLLLSMPDHSFDWIYIDGNHSYEGAKKDLEASHQKLKPDGLITLNDYIFFGSSDLTKYGVMEATNEFCIKYNYELIHLALHGRSYNDVTLRRIKSA